MGQLHLVSADLCGFEIRWDYRLTLGGLVNGYFYLRLQGKGCDKGRK